MSSANDTCLECRRVPVSSQDPDFICPECWSVLSATWKKMDEFQLGY